MKNSFDQWSLKKRVDLVYANSFAANIATLALSFLFVMALRGNVASTIIWSWLAVIHLVAAGRLFFAFRYRLRKKSVSINVWANRYVVSSVLMGSVWGCAGYFYYLIEEPTVKSLVFMALIGIIASAMIVLSALLKAFYRHIIPIFLGLFSAILLSEESYSLYLAGGLLVYLGFISVAGKNTHSHITESLRFQHKNQQLVLNLKDEITVRQQVQNKLEGHQERLEGLVEERTSQLLKTNEVLTEEIDIRKKAEKTLKHLAYHDDLTKLPNRLLLLDRLEHALIRAQRDRTLVAVIFIDLNGFKLINDTFGHAAGDHVLVTVAKRLRSSLREADTISRFGGDEFVILVEQGSGHENTEMLSLKIMKVLAQPVIYNDQALSISCSLGVSFYPVDGESVEVLLERADAAMYQAKDGEKESRQHNSS